MGPSHWHDIKRNYHYGSFSFVVLIGLATHVSFNYDWVDSHSGQDKDKYSLETRLLAQKYFMDGQMV